MPLIQGGQGVLSAGGVDWEEGEVKQSQEVGVVSTSTDPVPPPPESPLGQCQVGIWLMFSTALF